jgi:hypothetical protein
MFFKCIQTKADELDEKLEKKQAELAAAAQAKADVLAEFDRLVDPGHSHRESLLKVYNKRIKRIKKKENNRGAEDEDEDSDEEESDDEDMDDDEVKGLGFWKHGYRMRMPRG